MNCEDFFTIYYEGQLTPADLTALEYCAQRDLGYAGDGEGIQFVNVYTTEPQRVMRVANEMKMLGCRIVEIPSLLLNGGAK